METLDFLTQDYFSFVSFSFPSVIQLWKTFFEKEWAFLWRLNVFLLVSILEKCSFPCSSIKNRNIGRYRFPFFYPTLPSPLPHYPYTSPSFIITLHRTAYAAHLHLLRLYQNGTLRWFFRSCTLKFISCISWEAPMQSTPTSHLVRWRNFSESILVNSVLEIGTLSASPFHCTEWYLFHALPDFFSSLLSLPLSLTPRVPSHLHVFGISYSC